MKKRRRSPAPPLPVVVVRHLLSACLDTELSDELRLISGHLALCVFAVARWSDLRLMDGMHVSWPGKPSWALCLQDLRRKRNIQGGLPSLGRTGWLDTPMVTSEATAFLREIAQNVLEASIASTLRAHSLKTTLLTWAGACQVFQREERTLLGHHVEASTKSATTYDRDAAIRLQAKVHRMLTMIDTAELEPDSSRARKLEVLLRSGPSPSIKGKPAAEETSSEEETDEMLHKPLAVDREPLPESADAHVWWVHSISGITHAQSSSDGQKLACGRAISCNFAKVSFKDLDANQTSFCVQCAASRQLASD